MGLISGSGSFTRYLAEGPLPENLMEELSLMIIRHSFKILDEKSIAERSTGWVNVMDMFDNQFAGFEFLKEPYITMSLRVDERKIPATALKQYCLEVEAKMKDDENLEHIPQRRKADIRDAVKLRLLKRAIPVARTYDMIWNYNTGLVIFGCTSNKTCDEFMEFFLSTFGIQLQVICPYTLAVSFLEKKSSSLDTLEGLTPFNFSEKK